LQVQAELRALGLPIFDAAQSLPGILGKDGALALSPFASLCGVIPGLTTASRVAVHFWWNFGEIGLLLIASHVGVAKWLSTSVNYAFNPERLPQ